MLNTRKMLPMRFIQESLASDILVQLCAINEAASSKTYVIKLPPLSGAT